MNGDDDGRTPPESPDELARRLWQIDEVAQLDSALNEMARIASETNGSPWWFLKAVSILQGFAPSIGVDKNGFMIGFAFAQTLLWENEEYAVAMARIAKGRAGSDDAEPVDTMLRKAAAILTATCPMDEEAPTHDDQGHN